MISVIFVEDEKNFRDEIAILTPWEDMGLSLIGIAEDGIAGEQLIREKNPDIVITDIQLPGQNGLTMLRNCNIKHAIIVSGHSTFSYMQEAVRIEAFDYLLKPVEKLEFENTLQSLASRIKKKDTPVASKKLIPLPTVQEGFIVQKALKIIEKRFSENIGLLEIANDIGISESHLSRIFKEASGWNFMHYLNALRINKSLLLLEDSKNTILDIAHACGFSSSGYYTKMYQRFIKETPSQTRKKF